MVSDTARRVNKRFVSSVTGQLGRECRSDEGPANQGGLGSTFQSAEVGYQRLNIRLIEFFLKRRHFAFDSMLNDRCDSGVTFAQVIKTRAFVAARVISVAMRAVAVE